MTYFGASKEEAQVDETIDYEHVVIRLLDQPDMLVVSSDSLHRGFAR